jgi:hypothetical protein
VLLILFLTAANQIDHLMRCLKNSRRHPTPATWRQLLLIGGCGGDDDDGVGPIYVGVAHNNNFTSGPST